jgi:parvulin-like peptidyl-prolyl isomerase
MPSRDVRRYRGRKKAPTSERVKGQAKKRPLLYAGTVVVLVLVAISFIGAPMISRMSGRSRVVFGSYNGEEIVYTRGGYFAEQRDLEANRLRNTDQESSLESQLWQAWRYAFNQTVLHIAVMHRTEESGMWVSEDAVEDSLLEYGPYMADGEFSTQRYRATPQAERNAIARLRRDTLTQQRYIQDIFLADTQSTAEREFLRAMVEWERKFAFVAFNYADFPDDRVLAYGIANKKKFSRIQLSRILITSSRSEAEKVRDMALTGQGTFEDLARSFSKGPFAEKGGEMGWQYYHYFQALFGDEDTVDRIFDLEQDEVSELIPSGGSWVFFRCDAEAAAPDLEDAETLAVIRSYVATSERGVIDAYFVEQAEEFRATAEEEGFSKASVAMKVFPPVETEYFPINYAGIFARKPVAAVSDDSGVMSSAAFDPDFLTKLFSLEVGEVSEPITVGDNVVVATLLDERKMPEEDVQGIVESMESLSFLSLNQELGTILIDEDKLEDNFQEAFYKYVVPR